MFRRKSSLSEICVTAKKNQECCYFFLSSLHRFRFHFLFSHCASNRLNINYIFSLCVWTSMPFKIRQKNYVVLFPIHSSSHKLRAHSSNTSSRPHPSLSVSDTWKYQTVFTLHCCQWNLHINGVQICPNKASGTYAIIIVEWKTSD